MPKQVGIQNPNFFPASFISEHFPALRPATFNPARDSTTGTEYGYTIKYISKQVHVLKSIFLVGAFRKKQRKEFERERQVHLRRDRRG